MKKISFSQARARLSTLVARRVPFKVKGSMKLVGDLDQALNELRQEREKSLEKLVTGLK
jgi:hypothetical protein